MILTYSLYITRYNEFEEKCIFLLHWANLKAISTQFFTTEKMFFMQQGCHWTFAKITENLRVRAVSQKMNTKREKVQREKDEIGECGWRWPYQGNNLPMPCVVNFYF